ncbi:pantoate--beta-alanine ligase [Bacillus sp. Bva_UNVM-123]|uniref:pantoate--beta-alanine ligase n=1 Tax=Bacillus sp. Bva_UNVM-123 TaxID=2829798 RepID=UPI00391FAB47
MQVVTTIKEMQTTISREKKQGKSVGFVPTMGFLHEGHLELIKKARANNEIVVLSIFVNPIQFGPNEDFSSYPRDFERDKQLAEKEGADYIFYPSVDEMYPSESSVIVHVKKRTDVLCGKSRPGHFDGVSTVLTKLFHIIQPDKAYFGKKDAQQVAVVEGLVEDFNFPIEIIAVEIVREKDGLAKSSRNIRLLPSEREQASSLYESLLLAKKHIDDGEKDSEKIMTIIKEKLEKMDGVIDYVEILAYPSLEKQPVLNKKMIIALAVKFSKARLIDNLIINIDED